MKLFEFLDSQVFLSQNTICGSFSSVFSRFWSIIWPSLCTSFLIFLAQFPFAALKVERAGLKESYYVGNLHGHLEMEAFVLDVEPAMMICFGA